MSRIVIGLIFNMLILFTTSVYTPAVQAQQPTLSVRILHLPQWYEQRQPDLLNGGGNLKYWGGRVMQPGSTSYGIYWVPSGFSIDAQYSTLVNRYFSDIGGSTFYNIVTQYYQNPNRQHILNHSALGGWVLDTTPYPGGRGGANNPLTDADIRAEVLSVAAGQGWSGGTSNMFFVFTAKGVESCLDSVTCTPGTPHPAYCAYHGYFVSNNLPFVYANMPYAATWGPNCGTFRRSPNHDAAADTEISVTSHEHFEAVTDLNPPPLGPIPGTTAWTDSRGFEIGDKCAYKYGRVLSDGHNIVMNGHLYIMQLEWSNKLRGCAKSY